MKSVLLFKVLFFDIVVYGNNLPVILAQAVPQDTWTVASCCFWLLPKHSPFIGLQTNILSLVSVQTILTSALSAGVQQDTSRYQQLKSNISEYDGFFLDWEPKPMLTLSNPKAPSAEKCVFRS